MNVERSKNDHNPQNLIGAFLSHKRICGYVKNYIKIFFVYYMRNIDDMQFSNFLLGHICH